MEPLIDHICEAEMFAQDTKMIYNTLSKGIRNQKETRESENHNKFTNNTKR